jgi:hypothetical protein
MLLIHQNLVGFAIVISGVVCTATSLNHNITLSHSRDRKDEETIETSNALYIPRN